LTTGQVNFCDAAATYCDQIHRLGTAQLTSAGTAALKFIPGMGSHTYKAVFVGVNAQAASSSSPSSLTVTASQVSTTTIAQSGTTGNYTLTATVVGQGPISPSGAVSFLDTTNANSPTGSAVLAPSQTTLTSVNSQSPATGTQPWAVAAGDFNGDGKPDLAVTNESGNSVTILQGNGDGTFTAAASTLPTGNEPISIVAADFNGDGKTDLAVANANSSSVTILLGNGDGSFTPSQLSPQTGSFPRSIVVGDFNGDGKPDLAVANESSNSVTVLQGNGDGTFTATASNSPTGSYPESIAVGDFNGDGIQDLAVANNSSSTVSILLGNGDGTFSAGVTQSTGYSPLAVVVGDFNRDGIQDLAVSNNNGTLTILLGKGDGTFTATASSPSTGYSYSMSVAVADLNGDGIQDLAVTNYYSNSVTTLLGKGDGTFTTGASPSTGSYPATVVAGDFNGDGAPDLAVVNSSSNTVTILTSQLTRTSKATATGISPIGSGPHAVDASYAGDSSYKSSVSATTALTAQRGTATVAATPSSSSSTTTQALTVTVTVGGGAGNPAPSGSVTLTSGTYSSGAVGLTNGSASISVPAGSLTLGSDTLTASYAGDSNYNAASGTAVVTIATTTPSVAVWPLQTSITATQALSVTVGVSAGIGTPTLTGSVTLTSGSYTSAATLLSSGSATISIPGGSLSLGSDSLTASYIPDTASSSTYNGASGAATISVTPTVPTITFSVASQTYGSAPFAASATSNSTGAITYSVVSGPATISGSTVSLTGAGTVVLQANQIAAGNYTTGVQTATFTIAAAAPTITFTVPSHVYGDAPFAVSAVSNSAGAITYSVVSGPGTISGSTVTLTAAGNAVLLASQSAAGNYTAGTQTAAFVVGAVSPTITFTAPNQTYGNAPFTVSATSNSTGAITYSMVSGPATISGSTVTLTGAGTVYLTATQAAAGNYIVGNQIANFTVAPATPAIAFIAPNHAYGDSPFAVSATSNSTGTITYSVMSGPATISGSTVTVTGAGTVVLQASEAASANYTTATQTATFTVAAIAPTITFTVPNHANGDAPFAVSATSNSTGAIAYSVVSGPATLSGSTVTLTAAGTVVLQASQAAAGNYTSGAQNVSFAVATGSQTISFTSPVSPVSYGIAPLSLSATSTSGLTVTFSVVSGPASINGSTLTITGAGTVVVAADQSGNANYTAATEVTRSITVSKTVPAAGLTASPNPVLVQNAVTLTATVSSAASTPTGSVAFFDGAATLGTANLSNGIATLTIATLAVGTHAITAVYGGDGNFNTDSSASLSETVEDFTLTTGGSGTSQTVQPGGTATFTLPMSPSGGTTFPAAVTFSASGLPAGFTATFSPTSLAAGSSATSVSMTIQVPMTAMLERIPRTGRSLPLVALGLLMLPFVGGIGRSRKRLRWLAILFLLAGVGGATMLTGCGGGNSASGKQPQSYVLTVTATSGALSHSTTATLTVN
jgi:hypothetical protein